MSYTFYAEHDIDDKGRISSEYPSWYTPHMLREMEDEIANMEGALLTGQIPKGYEAEYRDNLVGKKERFEKAKDSSLVTDVDRGKVGDALKDVAAILKDEMPSTRAMADGFIDSDMELRKITIPYIKVDERIAELCQAANVPIVEGKVSREGLAKAWKIGTKWMGEYANVEVLRKR
jgi:hypothetical protein